MRAGINLALEGKVDPILAVKFEVALMSFTLKCNMTPRDESIDGENPLSRRPHGELLHRRKNVEFCALCGRHVVVRPPRKKA